MTGGGQHLEYCFYSTEEGNQIQDAQCFKNVLHILCLQIFVPDTATSTQQHLKIMSDFSVAQLPIVNHKKL